MFKIITEAFTVLDDDERRARLDRGEDPATADKAVSRVEQAILVKLDEAYRQSKTHPIRFVCDHYDQERSAAREELSARSAKLESLRLHRSRFLEENETSKNVQAKSLIVDYFDAKICDVESSISDVEQDIELFGEVLSYLNDIEKGWPSCPGSPRWGQLGRLKELEK